MINNQSFEIQSPGSTARSSSPFARLIIVEARRLSLAACATVRLLRRSRMRQETAHVTAGRQRLFEAAWHGKVDVPPAEFETAANEPLFNQYLTLSSTDLPLVAGLLTAPRRRNDSFWSR